MPEVVTIAELLARTDLEDREVAAWWAEPRGTDVARVVAECPDVTWLAAIGRELGQSLAVELWHTRVFLTPEREAEMAALEGLPARERAMRREQLSHPSREELDAAIGALRAALDVDVMRARLASYPAHETPDERDERKITEAHADQRALMADDTIDGMEAAGTWGAIGGRASRHAKTPEAHRRFQEESRRIFESRHGPTPAIDLADGLRALGFANVTLRLVLNVFPEEVRPDLLDLALTRAREEWSLPEEGLAAIANWSALGGELDDEALEEALEPYLPTDR